jgi:4-hydroxy-2-oxoheptanedioate aldolase
MCRKRIALSRYGPIGKRRLAGVRAAVYGICQTLKDYCRTANSEVMIIAQIEDLTAIWHLEQLFAVEGIDVIYLGPVDLPNSLGKPDTVDAGVQKLADDASSTRAWGFSCWPF